jgi:uncharacterized membrane protein
MTPLAKRLSIALAISIALNLLLAGILVGRALHRPPPPEREFPAMRGDGYGRRAPLRGLFREHGAELGEKRRAIAEARRTARAALEAEPFDRAALDRALEGLRKETVASQEIMHRAIGDAAEKGSPEERKRLGHALERTVLGDNERRPLPGRDDGPRRGR